MNFNELEALTVISAKASCEKILVKLENDLGVRVPPDQRSALLALMGLSFIEGVQWTSDHIAEQLIQKLSGTEAN